jgi:preprotein translocase subunit SecG
MTAANFITLFGMVAFFGIIVLLDWLSRRKDRQSHHRAR